MLLKYFYDRELAQASYLVGCAATGEALVVDPMRNIAPYLEVAEQEGMRITQVTETHIHADFVSGSRELAAATGAMMYLSDMGDADWKYGYAEQPNVVLVTDGDSWMLGNVKVEVVHTPGHTPEHISFMLTDTAAADQPIGLFTGDFMFVGDIGRPDLLEEAAGMVGTAEPGARRQYHTVERIKAMPDFLQIWPAHGAGSACGKALGAIPSTTLGYEKLFNPALQHSDEASFVTWLLDGQPEAPRYFARMKYVNKVGPALLSELPAVQQMTAADLPAVLDSDALVVDMRNAEDYNAAHVPGTLNVPTTDTMFSTYVGWFVDYTKPTYLIVPDEAAVEPILTSLRAIGIDNVPGYFLPATVAAHATPATLPTISIDELVQRLPANDVTILDVRGKTEYEEVSMPNAINVPLGFIPRRKDEIPSDKPIVVHCASGYRSQVGASLLRRMGFENVIALTGEGWETAIPTTGATA